MPVVSVLMTAFNREQYIAAAIESVLASTLSDFELIVTDDCSTDHTVAIAKAFEQKDQRVKVYVNEQNLGDYPNRNKAASYAKGKYIKYLDSDDLMYPHCLQVMVQAMEQFPEAGYGLSCVGDASHPYPASVSPHAAYWEHFNGYGHFDRAPGSAIIKKAAFDAVGGFSGERMIGDNELWLKIGRYYPLVKFPVDLYWARTHAGQESQSDYAKTYDLLRKKIFAEAFAHADCPLNEAEKASILQRMKRQSLKSKLKKIIR
jgi:glycosyltransferase involved in cell wall biosynthesis